MQQYLYDNRKKFLIDVAFNFTKTPKRELEIMIKEPKEFMELSLDVCDRQKIENIKSKAAKLIEGFCDKIDGSATFVC